MGEGEDNQMKHSLTYAYVCDGCLHNNTINNHDRHSHGLLNLVFTKKYRGMGQRKGRLGERRHPRRRRPVLNTEMVAKFFITSHLAL